MNAINDKARLRLALRIARGVPLSEIKRSTGIARHTLRRIRSAYLTRSGKLRAKAVLAS